MLNSKTKQDIDEKENSGGQEKKKRRERSQIPSVSRRRTLSPTTSRQILLNSVEEMEREEKREPESIQLKQSLEMEVQTQIGAPLCPPAMRTRNIHTYASTFEAIPESQHEALKRYKIRQEIARWKYCWEIVSHEAAMVALRYSPT